MRLRERIGYGRFFDVAHREQMADPLGGVRRIHEWLGWPMSPSLEADVSRWREEKPRGVHHPDPAHYGIEASDVEAHFATYTERFAELVRGTHAG